ncbi:phosphoribosylamine--glycine ligase [Salinicoccus jeotgali]|uniref:Phosphoribosylamine--glycine ligase n=1 Tax=Salinicoccus jeotgali TaxID=381634 RepID=A0ABP7EEH1_9STAP
MNVAVIGGGGREYALAKKLAQSTRSDIVYAIPGNDGMKEFAVTVPELNETDCRGIGEFCLDNDIQWVVIGPEASLEAGLADHLEELGVDVFGPKKNEAKIECSKAFAKDIMKRYDIPTASHRMFTDQDSARDYINETGAPVVLKKDGLAAGKGVIVAMDMAEALAGIEMLKPEQDAPVVIEEFLEGEEFSLMVLVNGSYTHSFEIMAQDHKRAYDGDTGPNTGGMGVYAPVHHIDESLRQEAVDKIVEPMAQAMVDEGLDYFGVLYLGAIVTRDGVKVIEFNARFGDPEAQVLLDLMEDDFIDVLEKVKAKEPFSLTFRDGYKAGVMLASGGYPAAYEKGCEVDFSAVRADCAVSGLKQSGDAWRTDGGRVLLVTGEGCTIEEAVEAAYSNVAQVTFTEGGLFYRRDIGGRALKG